MAAEPSSNANLTVVVDDFYFSALAHGGGDAEVPVGDEIFPISDEKYAAELQLQEVIMSSATARSSPSLRQRHTTSSAGAASIVFIGECSSTAPAGCGGSSSLPPSRPSAAAAGGALVYCKICMDAVPPSEAHRASRGCAHAFCAACLGSYIGAKIQDRIADIRCPDEACAVGVLDPALCQGMLPREVFERWGAALCEAMVLGAGRTARCPFKDCAAVMVADDGTAGDVAEAECPSCRRLFCARCAVPWHAGADCAAYRKLGRGDKGKEDMALLQMAKTRRWKRCPKCEFFVEKVSGCLHITCRCGFEFCYGCGKPWGLTHTSCSSA